MAPRRARFDRAAGAHSCDVKAVGSGRAEPLRVRRVEYRSDLVVLVVDGCVEISSAAVLGDAFARAMADRACRVIVGDLTAVRFLSAAGLRVLVEAAADARARGIRPGLVASESITMRVLRMSGVAATIPVFTALSDGIRELAAGAGGPDPAGPGRARRGGTA